MRRSLRVGRVLFHPSTLAVFSGLCGALIGFLINLASGGNTAQVIWIALSLAVLVSVGITAWQGYGQEKTGQQWMTMLQEIVFQTYFLAVLADRPEVSQIARQRLGRVLKTLDGDQQVSMLKFFSHNGLPAAYIGEALRGSSALAGAQLDEMQVPGIQLENANLSRANLSRADLSGANLGGTMMERADLSGANLSGSRLTGAFLRGVIFRGADLTGADVSGSTVVGADLRGASLAGADLTRADLSGANLEGADLTDANLTGAALVGAGLREADLTGATLTSAILDEVDLRAATVTEEQLRAAASRKPPKPAP